jgi:hypothetical protein
VSPANPLGAAADSAREARRRLDQTIATVDGAWNDTARHSFDAAHLNPVQNDARLLVDRLDALAEQFREASLLVSADR